MKKIGILFLIATVFTGCGSDKQAKTWNDVAKEAQKLEVQKNETIKTMNEKNNNAQ